MSKLTKEEVISALESALADKQGSAVTIEQKGSWYKIDGGKSLRFSELESMLAEMNGETSPQAATEAKAKPVAKTTKPKAVAKKAPATKKAKSDNAGGGKTPKELWREKLAGKGQLPRGF
ncbi:conserved hypothetical protein [Shewanella sediminis HAW-EB3]|uniref:Uncharacterized protein n=1 Tax=Shewanella sediminis (strain HAW-EB3) TaxID=425104 RepID=A8FUH9_SHESH|nr:hypothetical protein [Shewanella sediminis]ABV36502.1 conserved hypothetical protein [Shewanella sediminis HAW-EB3]